MSFLRPLWIRLVIAWVTVTEVNIDVRMPMNSVTPKPRIAPEPSVISASADNRCVTLASRIVAHALS